jgi:hypothetical protein
VTIKSKDRFNPRRGPPIRYVVHRRNCIMPVQCWRALNRAILSESLSSQTPRLSGAATVSGNGVQVSTKARWPLGFVRFRLFVLKLLFAETP